jgi:ABC-type branched-subunit amino acid transport system substrate-binding protein
VLHVDDPRRESMPSLTPYLATHAVASMLSRSGFVVADRAGVNRRLPGHETGSTSMVGPLLASPTALAALSASMVGVTDTTATFEYLCCMEESSCPFIESQLASPAFATLSGQG